MKAQSSVAIHVQEPMTVLGMPPLHAAFLLIGEMLIGTVAGFIGSNALGFALVLLTAPPAVGFIILLRRKEPHCEALLLLPNAFYSGRKERRMVSGVPVKPLKKSRKH